MTSVSVFASLCADRTARRLLVLLFDRMEDLIHVDAFPFVWRLR